jgi:hypothetical protein
MNRHQGPEWTAPGYAFKPLAAIANGGPTAASSFQKCILGEIGEKPPCDLSPYSLTENAMQALHPQDLMVKLILLLANLLAIALTRQRFFYALLLAWLQVERVTLDLLDNVFGLHLALKSAQCILKGLAFLNTNLCHE